MGETRGVAGDTLSMSEELGVGETLTGNAKDVFTSPGSLELGSEKSSARLEEPPAWVEVRERHAVEGGRCFVRE